MKNKLFLIVAICAMFSSCNKSTSTTDPTPTPTPTPDPEKTVEFVVPVMADGHRDFFELQYEFDLAGTKVSFKESDMTEMTPQDTAHIRSFVTSTEKALVFMFGVDHKETAQFYKYTLGKLKKGETASGVSRTPIIRTDRSAAEEFDILIGGVFFIEGIEQDVSQVTYNAKVSSANNDITKYFSMLNNSFKNFTYTYSK